MSKTLLFAGTCGLAILWAVSAAAQTTPMQPPDEVDEIIVTAQRRSERLAEVPISITVLSEETLEATAVSSTEDLTQVTPGLVFGRSNSFSQPTIRGIGSRNGSQGDESSVAIYIDGVYRPEQFSNLFELEGVQGIEVLKGPQGTLFGRNAAGGAINITTRLPSPYFEGRVTGSIGEFGYSRGSLYLSGPLSDTVGANLSFTALEDDGFIDNIVLGTTSGARSLTAARTKFMVTPNDATEIWLGLSYQEASDNTNQSGQPLDGNSRGRRIAGAIVASEPWTTSTQFPVFSDNQTFGADIHLNHSFAGFDLSSVFAYSHAEQYNLTDADNTSATVSSNETSFNAETISFETVLSSVGEGRLQWTAGTNLFRNDAALDPFISGAVRFSGFQSAEAASIFGEIVYEVFDNLFLTAGGRYSYESRSASYAQVSPTISIATGEDSWTDFSPRFVVRYQFSETSNVYASYTQGFKSGTFNGSSALGVTNAAAPENVDAFEIGVRTELADRVRIAAAAYHYRYDNLQVTVPMLVNGATVFALSNAAESRINGLEVTAEADLTDHFRVNAGLNLLDAVYESFTNAVVVEPDPALFFNGTPAGNRSVVRDVSGNRLSRSPEWTLSLGAEYGMPLLGGDLVLAGNLYSSAEFYTEPANRVSQPAYTQINASARWESGDGTWSVLLSGENLTDEEVYSQIFVSAIGDFVSYQRPSFVSLRLGYAF